MAGVRQSPDPTATGPPHPSCSLSGSQPVPWPFFQVPVLLWGPQDWNHSCLCSGAPWTPAQEIREEGLGVLEALWASSRGSRVCTPRAHCSGPDSHTTPALPSQDHGAASALPPCSGAIMTVVELTTPALPAAQLRAGKNNTKQGPPW